MDSDPKQCGTCRFWALREGDECGECRRSPPDVDAGGRIAYALTQICQHDAVEPKEFAERDRVWPVTHYSDWCGEWERVQEPKTGITFAKLCELDPRLLDMDREARALSGSLGSQPMDERDWVALKRRMQNLVGWNRMTTHSDFSESPDDPLRSETAYKVALDHFAQLLGI